LQEINTERAMDLKETPSISTRRSPNGIILFVVMAGGLLVSGATFDGPTTQISHAYWRWVAPVAIPAAFVIAWRVKTALLGSWYRPRGAWQERQMGAGESWAMGATAAAFLVVVATGAFANVMNRVVGVLYVAKYEVAGRFVERGKRSCYGLTLAKVGDPADQFQVCVSQT
jgi:hypothetical protein